MNYIKRLFSQNKNDLMYDKIDTSKKIDYNAGMMYEYLYQTVQKYPDLVALEYYGKNITYKAFYERIKQTAKSLKAIGLKEKETVTICMPNVPEALVMFYAVNMAGGIASMIHPLASENEIEFYIDAASSKYILTVNLFAEKVITAAKRCNAEKIIISDVSDSMFRVMKRAIKFYDGFKKIMYSYDNPTIKYNDTVIKWKDFYRLGDYYTDEYEYKGKAEDEAVILYSGGTTGKPKGVRLSNLNFNALSKQCVYEFNEYVPGDSILLILPIFHGFGIGVSAHTILTHGMKCVLIPRFMPEDFAKLIRRYKPVFLTGVPTMYEALIKNKEDSDFLKSVKYCISGGDLLSKDLRSRVNSYLVSHGSSAQIRVGYGLTESTAACILTPNYYFREGAIGRPFQDTEVKIVKPGTTRELKPHRNGEICITGPTVMLGYLNEEEETNNTLIKHEDGKIWLHTGDLGYVDKNGIIFFVSRLKRMFVTSGYNIYPLYMEKIIEGHPAVDKCVVVGIPHPYKKKVPVACIVLKENYKESSELTMDIKKYCEKSIAKYSMPYKYEYIRNVPKTIIGKINYKKLEDDCTRKYS